ncbi:hypothetical protein QNI19_14955 [Cytophagaceae bacterium DM2B3-1]|uniref:DUF4377 domain-containing protein n=2 Tax=Xanthocytophaga flava TaxID=3048013 RepID=A0ABT7CL27_9BACT|nr:hypothetical protein [Xanthocytophaga flavus]MDJ1494241.1 hypothetical protein [Xanthocytophaga flavus]
MKKYLLLLFLVSCSSPKVEVTASLVTMPPPPFPEYPIEVKFVGTVEPVRLYLKENLKNWASYKPLMDTVDNKEMPRVKYIVKHSYSTKK